MVRISAPVSNRALLGIAIVIACVCTLPVLGHRSLWLDEAVSLAAAQLDFGTLFDAVHHQDAAEFAYYAFLHHWVAAFGTRADLVRLPSALAAIAVVPLTYLVARDVLGIRTAVIASFLVAASFFIVNLAEQARPYSLALFFCVLATYCFLKLLEKASIARVAAYVAAVALAFALHAFAGLMVVAHVVSLPLLTDDLKAVRFRFIAAYALLGLLLAPFVLLLHSAGLHQIDWISKPHLGDIGTLFGEFIGRPDKPNRALVMVGAPCCLAIFAAKPPERRRVAAVLIWALLPIAIAFVASSWRPIFLPRYLFVSIVPLLIVIARGVAAIPNGWIAAACGTVLVVAQLYGDWKHRGDQLQDYRSAVRFLQANASATDAVVIAPIYCAIPYRTAQRELQSYAPSVTVPSADWRFWLGEANEAAAIPAAALSGRRLWLISRDSDKATDAPIQAVRSAIRKRLILRRTVYMQGLRIMEYASDQRSQRRLVTPILRQYEN